LISERRGRSQMNETIPTRSKENMRPTAEKMTISSNDSLK
jgi:hypothetical protein